MKLYYMPSACSLASHIVLEWIGKPYEAHRLSRDELKSPDYLKVNPMGAVPAITDGDWALNQNAAVLEYLVETHPDCGLMGDGTPRSRAEVRRWLGFVNSDVHKTFSLVFGPQRFMSSEAGQEELRKSASERLRELFGVADQRLAGREWLADQRSIADAYLYVVLRWARGKKIDLSGYDNLARFHDRMDQDAGVQRALKEEGLA